MNLHFMLVDDPPTPGSLWIIVELGCVALRAFSASLLCYLGVVHVKVINLCASPYLHVKVKHLCKSRTLQQAHRQFAALPSVTGCVLTSEASWSHHDTASEEPSGHRPEKPFWQKRCHFGIRKQELTYPWVELTALETRNEDCGEGKCSSSTLLPGNLRPRPLEHEN